MVVQQFLYLHTILFFSQFDFPITMMNTNSDVPSTIYEGYHFTNVSDNFELDETLENDVHETVAKGYDVEVGDSDELGSKMHLFNCRDC